MRKLVALANSPPVANPWSKRASLPANAPPKLVMSILPKLQAQHEQIIALLQEQNALLRQRQPAAPG